MDTFSLLKEFMLTPAPSGYESEMLRAMSAHMRPLCDHVETDRFGNCICRIQGTQPDLPRIMIFAHMDQLGFMVRNVTNDGYIKVDRLGGIPEKVLPSLRLLIRTEASEWVHGIFAVKSHHITPAEEKYRVDQVNELFVDVGASSREEVHDMGIYPGCPAIYEPAFMPLAGNRVCGTAVDNRGSCVCLVGIAEYLKEHRPKSDVFLVGTVQEEFNLRGAMMAARTVKPELAISLDVGLAGDSADLTGEFPVRLGEGPCIQLYSFHGRGTLNGTIGHEPLFRYVKETANQAGIHIQRLSTLGLLTDAAYIQLEGGGVATLEMGFPARYTHSSVEECDVSDIGLLAELVGKMAAGLDGSLQLNRF